MVLFSLMGFVVYLAVESAFISSGFMLYFAVESFSKSRFTGIAMVCNVLHLAFVNSILMVLYLFVQANMPSLFS